MRDGAAAARADGRSRPVRLPKCLQADPLGAFWGGLVLVALEAGLSGAAEAAGPGAEATARLFGWPALALPAAVLAAGLRRGGGRMGRADPVLLVLGVLLAASALARMRIVLGVVLGVG